jgi:hypothetical protein
VLPIRSSYIFALLPGNEIVFEEPIDCPKCRSPYWNKPRRGTGTDKQQQQQKKQQVGKKVSATGTAGRSKGGGK